MKHDDVWLKMANIANLWRISNDMSTKDLDSLASKDLCNGEHEKKQVLVSCQWIDQATKTWSVSYWKASTIFNMWRIKGLMVWRWLLIIHWSFWTYFFSNKKKIILNIYSVLEHSRIDWKCKSEKKDWIEAENSLARYTIYCLFYSEVVIIKWSKTKVQEVRDSPITTN